MLELVHAPFPCHILIQRLRPSKIAMLECLLFVCTINITIQIFTEDLVANRQLTEII